MNMYAHALTHTHTLNIVSRLKGLLIFFMSISVNFLWANRLATALKNYYFLGKTPKYFLYISKYL